MTSSKTPLLYLAVILLGFSGGGCVPPGGGDKNEQNDADFRAGMARKQAGNYVRAIESFERALQRNPRSASAHFELGLIYYQNVTNYVAAIYHLDRVQRLHPKFIRIDVVRELIKVCTQEVVRDAMGGFTVQMQREMERLERLAQENAELRQEVAQLQAELKQRSSLVPTGVAVGGERAPELSTAMRTESGGATEARERSSSVPVGSYTIRRGDTLYSIAKRHGLSEATLRAANPGVIPTRMLAGQVIRIPER
jgi:LysM repeat protein